MHPFLKSTTHTMTQTLTPKTVLISVSDKTGIIEFAQGLSALGIKILSTGGTAKTLQQAGLAVTLVSDVTQFPEIMQGRVKTLHPKVHGGILGRRDQHQPEADQHQIEWIDIVVCNLYPFAKTISGDHSFHEAIENIDIGGPSMIRAAAKNLDWVTVLTDQQDYNEVLSKLQADGIDYPTRQALSAKAFAHTAHYDSMIAKYLSHEDFPQQITYGFERKQILRYGENPHQQAAWYAAGNHPFEQQKQGKTPSFNNIVDSSSALACVNDFDQPACVVVKHANPCGVAIADNIDQAFEHAWSADSKSAFGGIVALNRRCTHNIASVLAKVFIEIIIAPGFDEEALAALAQKPNYRVFDTTNLTTIDQDLHFKQIAGGLLVQNRDQATLTREELRCVTEQQPTQQQYDNLMFAWQVVRHLNSNAILIADQGCTVGVGAGQVSRVDAVELAIHKSKAITHTSVLASDAFFPFRDSIDRIAQAGIKAIIQPGGSMRDQEVIDACNEHGIAMVFTGQRCFKH